MRTIGNDAILGDDHNAILHDPAISNEVRAAREGPDDNVRADAGIFVNNGTLNDTVGTNPDGRRGRMF